MRELSRRVPCDRSEVSSTRGWPAICQKLLVIGNIPILLKDEHAYDVYLAYDDDHVQGSCAHANENVIEQAQGFHGCVNAGHHRACADAHAASLHEHDCGCALH